MLARLFSFINTRAEVSVEGSKIAVCEHESSKHRQDETETRGDIFCGLN